MNDLAGESGFGGIANVRQILGKAGTEGTLAIAFVCEVQELSKSRLHVV